MAFARSTPIGKPLTAGVGDAVLDLKITEPLPNVIGKADLFGRQRDAGRVVVRYIGAQGGQAYFSRQNVTISSTDTTMSRTPMLLPNTQTTTMTGNVGHIPVNATSTTVGGSTYVPAAASQNVVTESGQIRLSAPQGGTLIVEGKTITVLRIGEGSVEYSVK